MATSTKPAITKTKPAAKKPAKKPVAAKPAAKKPVANKSTPPKAKKSKAIKPIAKKSGVGGDAWWKGLSKEQKAAYLKSHPNSKYGTKKKSGSIVGAPLRGAANAIHKIQNVNDK